MAARNQSLQNMHNVRLLQQQQQQNPGILQMTPVQNSGAMPSQGDMSMAYGGQTGTQDWDVPRYEPKHGPNAPAATAAPSQPAWHGNGTETSGRWRARMVGGGGYGQGMLMNPSLPQQQ